MKKTVLLILGLLFFSSCSNKSANFDEISYNGDPKLPFGIRFGQSESSLKLVQPKTSSELYNFQKLKEDNIRVIYAFEPMKPFKTYLALINPNSKRVAGVAAISDYRDRILTAKSKCASDYGELFLMLKRKYGAAKSKATITKDLRYSKVNHFFYSDYTTALAKYFEVGSIQIVLISDCEDRTWPRITLRYIDLNLI